MEKVGGVFLGLVLIILGAMLIIQPVFYDRLMEYTFDLRGYNIPLGIFMVILGIGFIWTSVRGKRRK